MITKKHALDDDFDSPRNVVTGNNVDYLSYKFDEMDLAASWRVLTKQKLTIVNGLRLENASWRTWAKQRNNLKTVSPDTLNWLKDSDVTWLYGPLQVVIKNMDDKDKFAKPKQSTAEETLGLITSPSIQHPIETPSSLPSSSSQKPLKSALKKVTMSDLLKRSVSELQISKDTTEADSISETNEQLGEFSPSVLASHRQPKLRFNQYVEQRIVVPPSEKKKSRLRFSNVDSSSSEEEPESDADSVIVMRKPSRSLKKIEPALLKTNSRSDHDLSDSSDDDNYSTLRSRKHSEQDWELESAESDAFVKHIIRASKGKERSRDPAADRVPSVPIMDDEISSPAGKSDYEYSFDDDDWDTHSQHVEDDPFSLTQTYAPIAPDRPVGCAVADKDEEPSSSLFNSIATWASTHLWPENSSNSNN